MGMPSSPHSGSHFLHQSVPCVEGDFLGLSYILPCQRDTLLTMLRILFSLLDPIPYLPCRYPPHLIWTLTPQTKSLLSYECPHTAWALTLLDDCLYCMDTFISSFCWGYDTPCQAVPLWRPSTFSSRLSSV